MDFGTSIIDNNLPPLQEKVHFKNFTRHEQIIIDETTIQKYIGEFWTSKQRQNNPLHEISYRACFKAELPRLFINSLTKEGNVVYDPFSGRGTTIIEAALLNRNIIANDINPLSIILSKPRLFIPPVNDVETRLKEINFSENEEAEIDLSMFYHPKTESEIVSLKNYLADKKALGKEDYIDEWVRMVATNRLTGHSKNFFSVYTLPPNQATSQERQKKINELRNQFPVYKNVKEIILKKTIGLVKGLTSNQINQLKKIGKSSLFLTEDASNTVRIKSRTISLTVTSPPFLDVVNYKEDNWLRCWFNNIDAKKVEKKITMSKRIEDWCSVMQDVFHELYRITKKFGFVAFEVGEIRNGKIKLEEYVVPLGLNAGFECVGIMINQQEFTKTANIWGISNNKSGTNTNRIVIFRKDN
jgi:hypothetical protein